MTLLSQRGPTRQRKDNTMTCNVFSRAANAADAIIYRLMDRLNGNTTRRQAIKRRLIIAMLASEGHRLARARAHRQRTA